MLTYVTIWRHWAIRNSLGQLYEAIVKNEEKKCRKSIINLKLTKTKQNARTLCAFYDIFSSTYQRHNQLAAITMMTFWKKFRCFIEISLKFVPKSPIVNNSSLFHVMSIAHKQLPEQRWPSSLTYTYVTRHQRENVNPSGACNTSFANSIPENRELSWCKLCRHGWLQRLSFMTTYSATNDGTVCIMTTFIFGA